MKQILLCVALLAASALGSFPAAAAPLAASDLLSAAGLNPHSTLEDAKRLYSQGQTMPGGVEFFAKDSRTDAWLIVVFGKQVYVDCDEAPPNLPNDAIATLCKIAVGKDWRIALASLQDVLSLGTPTPGIDRPEKPEEAEHAPGAMEDSDDDDDAFGEVARTFHAGAYTIAIEARPRVETRHDGRWCAAVVISWTPA